MGAIETAAAYSLIPAAVLLAGGGIAAVRRPGRQLTSYLQHFAGGVVLAALTTELLPQVMHRHAPFSAAVGFVIGTGLMLAIRGFFGDEQDAKEGEAEGEVTGSMVVAVGIDLLIDGFLIGLGFAAGARTGLLLTFALGLEVLFLGLSTTGSRPARTMLRMMGYALVLVIGAVAGAALAGKLNDEMMEGALAFGAAALIYLVTEELLVEAHEVKETPISVVMFSGGFLAIMVIDMIA
jgi:ZIP family zinc transporter